MLYLPLHFDRVTVIKRRKKTVLLPLLPNPDSNLFYFYLKLNQPNADVPQAFLVNLLDRKLDVSRRKMLLLSK